MYFKIDPLKSLLLALTVSATLISSGCATRHIANEDSLESQAAIRAEQLTGNTQSALDKAEEAIAKAKGENYALLTPLHWQQMNDAIKLARKEDLASNSEASVAASARVLTLAESAEVTRVQVQDLLSQVLRQKAVLDDVKADKVLPKEYRAIRSQIMDLARLIEAGKAAKIDGDINDLMADMDELERDTMLEIHWRPALQTLAKAEKEGVDDYAPETFSDAEAITEEAEDTIREQYSNRQLSTDVGLRALRAAQHALYIGREAESIINMDIDDAEHAALRFESYLHQLAEALNAGDLRNMAFLDQTLALVQKAREQADSIRQPLQQRIQQLEAQLQAIQNPEAAQAPQNP